LKAGVQLYKHLLFERQDSIGILTLNRPEMNALCNEMVEELDDLLTALDQNQGILALIITGRGAKAFMAGADISELIDRDFIQGRRQTKRRQEVFNKISDLHVPTIAAINGFALGAGLELALACTIRVASHEAKFGSPEVNLGIIPGDGATQRLPRIIGQGRAMYMIMSGELINAEEALQYGMISKILSNEDLLAGALHVAGTIAKKAPLAVMYAKEAINRSLDASLSMGLTLESYLHALSCAGKDKQEGVIAFLEKRKPNFTGR
jgi:enoyl-CoA hydratase